jgi:hypothetical protein
MTQALREETVYSSRALDFAHEVARIEALIQDLDYEPDMPNCLMREHLEAARYYLLGSMPEEFSLTVKLAMELLPEIADKQLRQRIAAFLEGHQEHAVT